LARKRDPLMQRPGYTLIELALVLAVLVIVAALTFPLIEPMLSENNVTAAQDVVRARWAETRGRALEEGRAYRFAVTENTGKFRIAPDDDLYWSGNMTDGTGADDKPLILEGELPEGVLFTTSASAFHGATGAPAPGADWGLAVAVFLPNGQARDDAQIYFGKAGQRVLGLQLRSLTGAVTTVDAGDANNREGQP
jgi:prepilin-type N-terminal cleavage/methylation domain-containing protein